MTDTTSDKKVPNTQAPTVAAAEVAARRAANKTAVFDALARAGIDTVAVRFDGYGDSGQIEEIEARAGGRSVDLPLDLIEITVERRDYLMSPPSMLSLREAIEELAYACLDDIQSSWEDGDGAYGDFVLDVAARTIALEFNERFTDATTSQHSF